MEMGVSMVDKGFVFFIFNRIVEVLFSVSFVVNIWMINEMQIHDAVNVLLKIMLFIYIYIRV